MVFSEPGGAFWGIQIAIRYPSARLTRKLVERKPLKRMKKALGDLAN